MFKIRLDALALTAHGMLYKLDKQDTKKTDYQLCQIKVGWTIKSQLTKLEYPFL